VRGHRGAWHDALGELSAPEVVTVSYPAPRYRSDTGEISATLRRHDSAPDLVYPNGVEIRYLATGATTAGEFGLYRYDFSASRGGPDPHFHKTISESFFIISGTVSVYDGTGWKDTTAGDYLFVPEGGLHGFRNESGAPASMLILFAPGAPREDYFETLAHAADRPMTDDERAEFMLRHDTYWV
jgi:mannose-6-phosphate isomerase-like protein (cupin superfamily)